ncbi:MAG TPA: bifunctional diaminohydroxyphosphoribosylaminopyrimidine deaminase/5-amino-6-(5-phosphoribosylamino)uracil reductase RibD [Chthoniobacterales bacterium]|nr:bifunctional diaminohydroxyphosphoribosylaminopyrimidine deaminase/5-amino-6-(5-phosphoribosylamino)uracil reductase RibD [Chthoniobacterales bacterium]
MNSESTHDESWMRIALGEARKALGSCSPNPAVGAVIVNAGRLLARSYHRKAGRPHAEIEALRRLHGRHQAEGATLYVTLEPCSTTGRTPPCTEAIIRSGIRRVVVGAIDPNPIHQGRGLQTLHEAGILVTAHVLEQACTLLNVGFNRWIGTRRPWVIAKIAQSLDGRITRPPTESRWLTGEQARHRAHQLRSTVDAILVGAETVRRDDPLLTVRNIRGARQPWRVVVTRSANLPPAAHLFTDRYCERTIVFQNRSWDEILADLGQRGVTRLLVEGGGDVLGQLFDQGRIDELWSFFAPILVAGDKPSIGGSGVNSNESAASLKGTKFERLGDDVLVRGLVAYSSMTGGLQPHDK